MRESWEILTAGPPDAARSVLLLPGGAMAPRSFNLVMAEPAVSPFRLVATTLPGMAGAPLSGDLSIPGLARRAGQLANITSFDEAVAAQMITADDIRTVALSCRSGLPPII